MTGPLSFTFDDDGTIRIQPAAAGLPRRGAGGRGRIERLFAANAGRRPGATACIRFTIFTAPRTRCWCCPGRGIGPVRRPGRKGADG